LFLACVGGSIPGRIWRLLRDKLFNFIRLNG
jgi:hypothetical protein